MTYPNHEYLWLCFYFIFFFFLLLFRSSCFVSNGIYTHCKLKMNLKWKNTKINYRILKLSFWLFKMLIFFVWHDDRLNEWIFMKKCADFSTKPKNLSIFIWNWDMWESKVGKQADSLRSILLMCIRMYFVRLIRCLTIHTYTRPHPLIIWIVWRLLTIRKKNYKKKNTFSPLKQLMIKISKPNVSNRYLHIYPWIL